MRPATTRRPRAAFAPALAALALAGCAWLPRPAVVPLATQLDRAACTRDADTLLVLLPGRGMGIDEFAREGFIAAAREQRLAVDLLRADAHIAYYEDGRFVRRLRDDIVGPARASGYRRVWLAGISMGGFGALAYASERPDEVEGVLALAPYLGQPDLIEEVRAAGGLRVWAAPAAAAPTGVARSDFDRRLLSALKPYAVSPQPPGRPALYLGFGLDDRFADAHRLLADALPAERVFTAPGGHDWDAWTPLWRDMLAKARLPRCAA